MVIMKGDARTVPLTLSMDGLALTPALLDDLEICIGSGENRRLYSAGDIQFDPDTTEWSFRLSQEDTFAMKCGIYSVIARVKWKNVPDFDVTGVNCGTVTVTNTHSKEVL